MIIASPWSRGGWVNSQLFDHTSTLMFLENFVQRKYGKSAKEENISAWRRAISGNLTSAFRPYDRTEPELDFLNRDKFVVSIQKARYKEIPSNYRKLETAQIDDINRNLQRSQFTSHQEPGVRTACALPYELYAEGGVSSDGTSFELRLTAADKVYLRNLKDNAGEGFQAATFAVITGDTLHRSYPLALFADSKYSIEVYAPNGFYRSFSGVAGSAFPRMRMEYETKHGRPTGNVVVRVQNESAKALTVAVADNSYGAETKTARVASRQEHAMVVDLQKSHGWYDFTVKAGSDTEAHFAGRVETGRSSISDPMMGAAISRA
jgi:phospholipase C